jgi:hypothetical protein
MQMLILVGFFALVGLAVIVGWAPDTRTGRDWQPREDVKTRIRCAPGRRGAIKDA